MKNKNIKVSIVIPAYNEEKFIGNCLQSIFDNAGDYKNQMEVIVVNNNSTDKTKEVASRFEGVEVIDEPRKGVAYARNAGYKKAKGELIANIDSDCLMPKGWLEEVVKTFDNRKKTLALSGPYHYFDLTRPQRALVKIYYRFGYLIHYINQHILHVGAILQGGNFVIRRSVVDQLGGYDTKYTFYGEETDTAKRVQKLGEVRFDLKLIMPTSARRLIKEGIFRTGAKYIVNYFSTIFFKKPFHKTHQDVRP
jgi:glycosyltransferase involved in cell wall biosynthesis